MSVANRRQLLEAAHALVQHNQPTPEHYQRVLDTLGQVISDDTGMHVKVVMTTDGA